MVKNIEVYITGYLKTTDNSGGDEEEAGQKSLEMAPIRYCNVFELIFQPYSYLH